MRQGFRVIDTDTHVNPSLDVLLRYADPGLQAHQAHEVAAIAVEVEAHEADLVAAAGRVARRLAVVGHVAQQVTLGVLRPRLAQVHADAPVGQAHLVSQVIVEQAGYTRPVVVCLPPRGFNLVLSQKLLLLLGVLLLDQDEMMP